MEIFLSICLGIGLSAACGFRVFVPLLCLSIAAKFGNVPLTPAFAWLGSTPAIIALGVATVAEVVAYYVPWVDNALDSIAVPLATVAGVVATAAVVADFDPFWRWTLAIIAGGGIATSTQIATTKARLTSSATTGGLANPLLATVEAGVSTVLSVVSFLWPIVALVLAALVLVASVILIYLISKGVMKLFRGRPEQVTATS